MVFKEQEDGLMSIDSLDGEEKSSSNLNPQQWGTDLQLRSWFTYRPFDRCSASQTSCETRS